MSFITAWSERLQATRLSLRDNTIINDPVNYTRPTGMLDFLLNPAFNTRTIDTEMVRQSQGSEFRDVQIRYHQHWGTGDLVTSDASLTCTKTNQRRDILQTVQPTLFTSYKFSLYEDYLRENNEAGLDRDTRLTEGFRQAMRVCREDMSSQLLAKEAGLFGANPAAGALAGSYTSFQAINSNYGVDINNFDKMVNDQMDNYMSGPIGVIGFGGNPRKYFNRLAVGNVNTNAGVDVADIARRFGAVFFHDYSTETNLGDANRLLAFYPGMAQFFHYNLNGPDFAKETPNSLIKGTMPDPIYPFSWDYDIQYDNQCTENGGLQGAWTVRVWLYFDVWNVPEQAFGDTYGELNDFNGVVGYEMTAA